jgi:hypothetical protein
MFPLMPTTMAYLFCCIFYNVLYCYLYVLKGRSLCRSTAGWPFIKISFSEKTTMAAPNVVSSIIFLLNFP